MAGEEIETHSTNSLLGEILNVLRRMDGRLQGQEERIGFLEKTLNTKNQDRAVLSRIEPNPLRNMSVDSYSPTADSAMKQQLPKLRTPAKFRLMMQDELPGRRSSAWNEHQDVLNQLRRESIHHTKKSAGDEKATGSLHRSHSVGPKGDIFRQRIFDDKSLPPMDSDPSGTITIDFSASYAQYPPPQEWISTNISGRLLDIQYGIAEGAESTWKKYVGDSWTIPPDGRVELSFQRHLLERLDEEQTVKLLKLLSVVTNNLEYWHPGDRSKRGSFRVSDFDIDPNYEESGIDYRAEFFTGMYKSRQVKFPRTAPISSTTACWKRMIEIRGLSRKLIEEDEMPTVFRDPWAEALPILNPICPFFTEREDLIRLGEVEASEIIDQALENHQRCLPFAPSKEGTLCFHLVFYEIVSLRDHAELEDEIWKHGKLHSDDALPTKSRRIRKSACTIIVIPDPVQSKYWTSLYLCPFLFDLYEKVPSVIATQDAPSVAADMIEFTMRMVIGRWLEVADYFSWLIGHREALVDPDVHDSLLFDDASFSRSRRYFWAINYLAELDESIAGNILQLERWIAQWPQHLTFASKEMHTEVKSLPERLSQLIALQLRLKALRQEAIALRDGLFSASGVIESRAATRLGENVKLLTFVSIFFLPLSFCMSVWSISDSVFSLTSLAIVAVLIPCGTYFVVFNLNNLVRIYDTTYKQSKRRLVSQMKEDADTKWNKQGKLFETFRPRAERVEPSDWMIGFFIIHKLARATGIGSLFRKKIWRQKQRRETKSEEIELDFSILNGPRAAANSTKPGTSNSTENRAIFKVIPRLSFKSRRGAVATGPATGV